MKGKTTPPTSFENQDFSLCRRLISNVPVFCCLDSFWHLRAQLEIVLPLILLIANTNLWKSLLVNPLPNTSKLVTSPSTSYPLSYSVFPAPPSPQTPPAQVGQGRRERENPFKSQNALLALDLSSCPGLISFRALYFSKLLLQRLKTPIVRILWEPCFPPAMLQISVTDLMGT